MESLTVADGLSQGFALCLHEDHRGFIWIGTFNGINRYDGNQIKRFTPDNSSPWSIKASYIYCIAESADGLLWLGTDKGLIVLDPYTERFVSLNTINPAFPDNDIVHLDLTNDGRIWCCTRQAKNTNIILSDLYVVQPPADLVRLIREDLIAADAFKIQSIAQPEGLTGPFRWLNTGNDNIMAVKDHNHTICQIDTKTLMMQRVDPHTLNYQRLGNYNLMYYPNKMCGFVFRFSEDPNDGSIQPLAAFIQVPGELPLLYQNGDAILYQLDTVSALKKNIPDFRQQFKPFLKLDNSVSFDGIVDQTGNLWIGTTGYGIRRFSLQKLAFTQYLPAQSFYNFVLLPDGRIWPGRSFPHNVLNPGTNQLELAPWENLLIPGDRVYNLLIDHSGDWWLLAGRNGQLFLTRKEHLSGQWRPIPINMHFFEFSPIQLLEDNSGHIWATGNAGQVIRINAANNQVDSWSFDQYFTNQQKQLLQSTCIVKDKNGTLWIGCNYGLVSIEHPDKDPAFKVWRNEPNQKQLFGNEWIMSILPDAHNEHLLWIGTRGGGLHIFDSQTSTTQILTEKDGLVNNIVYGILPDAYGYLWLSTNRGLSRFNPKNRTFYNFLNEVPALNTEFNTDAYRQMPSGTLAFGSVNGLFLIQPFAEQQIDRPCVVAVTGIKINGIALDLATAGEEVSYTLQNEMRIQVPFEKNSITLDFAALQTSEPASAQFRYRMVGLDEHWIQAGLNRTANFALLPPGQYTLELQSINANGNWTDAPVSKVYITIVPPWHRTWLAWLLYLILAALILHAYIRYQRRYLLLKYKENIRRKEVERLTSLDDFKNRFFGAISHEFKTPLTIILGQAKRIADGKNQQNISQNAEAILQQGQSMLEMVTQMVDITKLDKKEIKLNWRNGNFSSYVRYIVESLRALAEFKNIQLNFHSTLPDLMMDFDPLRLKFIINNLLTNAIRHTPSGGRIGISIRSNGPGQIVIDIVDTGEGIAEADLPRIFDQYYQGFSTNSQEHNFGIGLTFVKDLVQLFGGSIAVSSESGKGTRFTIAFPVLQNAPPLDTIPTNLIQSDQSPHVVQQTQKSLPLLLVVEDNPYISNFIQDALTPHFMLEFAPDGLLGLEKALKIIPDLILTDVMMPSMDGYELTQHLKTNELTSHIPIVMLSARSGVSDRLTGQQYGANAYIGKPFDEQELILILTNLQQLQHRWRARYAGLAGQIGFNEEITEATLEQSAATISQTDAFMIKMYAIFEANYTNENYDLLQFCRDIEMSKSQLQRKVAALSDQTAMELLRRFRLQKAYKMLSEDANQNVKEICFQVGFKDPSHFSRLFSKTFQIAPSDVKKAPVV